MSTSSYADCVASMRSSLSFLESSVCTLGNGVSDFPRLAKVLRPVRHYELIPQPRLQAAEASLRDEISPFVDLLLHRAERQLERQERKIETLKARYELNAGRLSSAAGNDVAPARKSAKKLDGEAALRAKVVRQRKEALKYSVERLEMEVAQKERDLRFRLERGA
ncbi:hypothetical protein DL546_001378 [Coniochaeta pulveracea]|uniref:DASH complex subunit SPC19 n=1 Tax=Coniochaeta pulveracea TaxID=177199 RepID=A0A420XWV0_9PEZI|nr:hypothetical protein DL546_001378 [Coniochaeta pulveracea]